MRAWPLHIVFAAILVGSLTIKERTDLIMDSSMERSSLQAAVIRVARSHGWAFRGKSSIDDTGIPALAFAAPGCAQPVLVGLDQVSLSPSFREEDMGQLPSIPDYVQRYVYIGQSWDKPNRLAVVGERIKYAALRVFGSTRYVPSRYSLLIETPRKCRVADGIDWRIAWSRDYLVVTPTNPGAAAADTRIR